MRQKFRVRDNERFQEIRQQGKSFSDRYIVLGFLPNALPYTRFGFVVSTRLGNAVVRNRIKRQLREAMRMQMKTVLPGWDIVIIARQAIKDADYQMMDAACARLLGRAHLLRQNAQ